MNEFTQKTETLYINKDPVWGGLIDKAPAINKWFVIYNHDYLMSESDFETKEEAYQAWYETVGLCRMNLAMSEVNKLCEIVELKSSEWERAIGVVGHWSYKTIETPNGNKYRIGASGGGLISINGNPFHKDGYHLTKWDHVFDMIFNHEKEISSHPVSLYNI
ncbi:MAG: hypothetical protein JHC39_06220 [Lentimicrobium sp.]|nr:hypothetical protein [Lentimicrobium sp.]